MDFDPSVCGRIPLRTNRDDRYLSESFQALPRKGYHVLFGNMVHARGSHLKILLNTNYREILHSVTYRHLLYTGLIDEFYDYRFGALPYRSLRFEPESLGPHQLIARKKYAAKAGFWQPAMPTSYADTESFTRAVEIKHPTGQISENTTIVPEYPRDYVPGGEVFYPIPAPDAGRLYEKHRV